MTKYEFPKSKLTFLIRGITGACPRCGSHKTHIKYFNIRKNCIKCDLLFDKEPGYWTGAMALNVALTSTVIVLGLVIGLVVTSPNIAVVPIILALLPIAIFTHTHILCGWQSIMDLWLSSTKTNQAFLQHKFDHVLKDLRIFLIQNIRSCL